MKTNVIKDLQKTFTSFPEGFKNYLDTILPDYGKEEWLELASYFGSILSALTFKPESSMNEYMDEVIAVAIKSDYQYNSEDPNVLRRFRIQRIDDIFCELLHLNRFAIIDGASGWNW